MAHTASGHGGLFAVELDWDGTRLRLAVADGGSSTVPSRRNATRGDLATCGRGLDVVAGLSDRTGVSGDHRGRIVWAEFAWPGTLAWLDPRLPLTAGLTTANGAVTVAFPGTG